MFRNGRFQSYGGAGSSGGVAIVNAIIMGIDFANVWILLCSTGCVIDWVIVIADVDCRVSASYRRREGAKLTAETSWVNIAMAPNQESTEYGLRQ